MAGDARIYQAHPTVAGVDACFKHVRLGCGALHNRRHQKNKGSESEAGNASTACKGGVHISLLN
jgi:hypothetical protein